MALNRICMYSNRFRLEDDTGYYLYTAYTHDVIIVPLQQNCRCLGVHIVAAVRVFSYSLCESLFLYIRHLMLCIARLSALPVKQCYFSLLTERTSATAIGENFCFRFPEKLLTEI